MMWPRLIVLRASERLIKKPQTIGMKVKIVNPINIGLTSVQKAICASRLERRPAGTATELATGPVTGTCSTCMVGDLVRIVTTVGDRAHQRTDQVAPFAEGV